MGRPVFLGRAHPAVVTHVLVTLIPYIFPKPADRELGRWFPRSNRLAQILLAVIVFCLSSFYQ